MCHLRLLAAVILAAACLFTPCGTYAQPLQIAAQLPAGFRDDAYVQQLIQLIKQWNAKELKSFREVLIKQLQVRIDSVIATPQYAYQKEPWGQAMVKQAQALPAVIEPKFRVNESAALVLVALFIKDIDRYKREVQLTAAREQLQTPLTLILARAQEIVKEAEIDAASIVRSTLGWWTAVWPFCDR